MTRLWRQICVLAAALTTAAAGLSGDAAEPTDARSYRLQLGLGFSAPFNLEEPFINLAQTRPAGWSFNVKSKGRVEGGEAIDAGYLDAITYMPTAKSNAAQYAAVGVFLPGAEQFRDYYADTYVLDWKGKASGMMQRWEGKGRSMRGANSVEYKLSAAQATGGSMRFSSIGEGFTDIRLYRKKYAALIDQGEIWNPAFIDYVRRYDIVRTMDIQSTNNIAVRRFDQIATMSEPWGQRATNAWPEPPFFSAPYEILFDLGVKADVEIWMTLPPQLGSPISSADPSLGRTDRPTRRDVVKLKAAAEANGKKALASPEWDIFAREFVDRYVASGYPLARPLYLEVGNEIWNFAGGFTVSSNYAIGIAKSVDPKWQVGHGYGVLVARYMMALEKEFARRKLTPNVTYVIGSHTANPWRTKQALDGVTDYLKANGADPKRYYPKTAVAVTNYYGNFNAMSAEMFGSGDPNVYAPQWLAEIEKDPDAFAKRISDLLTAGPRNVKATGPWIVARWAEHRALAEKAGSRLLGGYEGGSHLNPPKQLTQSKAFMDWWMAYHWSEQSAGVGRTINRDLIKAFPGVVLANYESIGALKADAPWIDGHYAKPTPVLKMWDEFARPDRVK